MKEKKYKDIENKLLNSSKNFTLIKTEKICHSKNSKIGELTIKSLPYFNIKNVTLLILLILLIILFSLHINQKISLKKYKNIILEVSKNQNNNLLLSENITKYKTIINSNIYLTNALVKRINEVYKKNGFVNINEIESNIPDGRSWIKTKDKTNEINVGAAFDVRYILESMMTIASVMDSQKPRTKIRLHFAVVDGFSAINMLKVYLLRERIREDVEFNFYNAKRAEIEFQGIHPKGNALCARLLDR